MTAPVRRKTARERDRELIAKGAPYCHILWDGRHRYLAHETDARSVYLPTLDAICRELNRIAAEVRKEKRRG